MNSKRETEEAIRLSKKAKEQNIFAAEQKIEGGEKVRTEIGKIAEPNKITHRLLFLIAASDFEIVASQSIHQRIKMQKSLPSALLPFSSLTC